MAERFQKIPGTQKISESYGVIDQNFEQLDNELSAIEQRIDALDTLSPADRTKLDGIEEGAQVNQNAIAKINDVEADDPSDAVTIVGGTGIAVTSNPLSKEVIVTATGEATPGPHATSHLQHGSDPIPLATTTEGGLMSAEDKQALEALKGLPSELDDLAGPGRTTETVKGNADALAAHLADFTQLENDYNHQVIKLQFPIRMMEKIKKKNEYKLTPPTGFTWNDAPINIYKNLSSEIYTDFDAADFQHVGAGKTYYVDVNNGDDSNDGLTPSSSLKSVHVALAKSDVDIIIVAEGYYQDLHGFNNLPMQNKNITIKAAPGANVIISTERKLAWTKTEGYTNVYNASRTQVATVWDGKVLDKFGDYTKLQEVESIASVDATPGSYYYNSPNLYVHTVDSRAADSDIHVFLNLRNLYNTGDSTTYIEGIKLYGGNSGAAYVATTGAGQNPLFVAKDCEFKYASEGNGGFTALGADVILQKCVFSRNAKDGANYHARNGRVNRVIEVDCVGRNNGLGRNTDTDNNSSIHDGGKIIRVNCTYHGSEGPNVHDINAGTESWNIGCESYASAATLSSRNSNYMVEDGAKMWLDTCIGYDSDNAFRVWANGELYIRNVLFDDGNQLVDGTLVEY